MSSKSLKWPIVQLQHFKLCNCLTHKRTIRPPLFITTEWLQGGAAFLLNQTLKSKRIIINQSVFFWSKVLTIFDTAVRLVWFSVTIIYYPPTCQCQLNNLTREWQWVLGGGRDSFVVGVPHLTLSKSWFYDSFSCFSCFNCTNHT